MSTRKEQVATFWQQKAPTLPSMFLLPDAAPIDREERPEVLSYLPSFENKTVLDLAAGIGRMTGEFAKKASGVLAVDLIDSFTEENRRQNNSFSNITYLSTDAMDLTLKPESFDLIFVGSLFMYLDDTETKLLMERIASWLKPKGHLFFRESCSPAGLHLQGPYYVHYRSLRFYEELVKKMGLKVRKTGSIKAYLDHFADPFKCFWLCQK